MSGRSVAWRAARAVTSSEKGARSLTHRPCARITRRPGRNGTNRTASSSVVVQFDRPVRTNRHSVWSPARPRPVASGASTRPPTLSCSSSASGNASPAAAISIASNGRGVGRARAAVAVDEPQVRHAQRPQVVAGAVVQRADALDRVHLADDLREHGRLVAAAGADLQHARLPRRDRQVGEDELGHPRRRRTAARSSARGRSAAPCRRTRGSTAPSSTKRCRGTCVHRGEHRRMRGCPTSPAARPSVRASVPA